MFKHVSRATEILIVHHKESGLIATWKARKFHQLKRGDIFRLWDTDPETGECVPDFIRNNQHDICVALEDADSCKLKDGSTLDKYFIECVPVRGMYETNPQEVVDEQEDITPA